LLSPGPARDSFATMTDISSNGGPLSDLRVLDLTRILAGPTSTQILGDLGADIIKVEMPGVGDDTRKWGPPYVKDKNGDDTRESAYYLSSNRNKRSVSIDLSAPEGQQLVRRLIGKCDILVENFKVGGLAKFGLSYEHLLYYRLRANRTLCPSCRL
jgi:crotonobetainyl-CoA:carnitine CoA-transferase CaiB-like acyl-CoA transferase